MIMKEATLPDTYGAWLTINRKCNLNCTWCYAKPEYNKNCDDMTHETVDKAISLFQDLPVSRVILIGGEPTIHPDFIQYVKTIKSNKINPVVITNGILFSNAKFLQKSIDAGLGGITISLKAHNNESYQQHTGKRAFNAVMSGIKNIAASGIGHDISITIGADIFNDIDCLLEVVEQSGARSLSLDMERPIIINDQTAFNEKSSPQNMADFFVDIYPKVSRLKIPFVLKIASPFCFFPPGFIENLIEKKQIVAGCHIYRGAGIIIDPSGNVLPCNHFCHNPIATIGKDFSTAADYVAFRSRPDIINFYKIIASHPNEKCIDCHYWSFCGGGCRMHWLHQKVF